MAESHLAANSGGQHEGGQHYSGQLSLCPVTFKPSEKTRLRVELLAPKGSGFAWEAAKGADPASLRSLNAPAAAAEPSLKGAGTGTSAGKKGVKGSTTSGKAKVRTTTSLQAGMQAGGMQAAKKTTMGMAGLYADLEGL